MKIYNLSKKEGTNNIIGTYLIYLTNIYYNNFCLIKLNILYDKHITKNFFVTINILKEYRINQIPSLLNYIQYNFSTTKHNLSFCVLIV